MSLNCSYSKNKMPDWASPEKLRWAWWGWEPMAHRRRAGGHTQPFLANSLWSEKWHNRLFAQKTVSNMAELGINVAITHFFKGFGLQAEREEMEQTKNFIEICHRYGIKVFGYTQFSSIYYESFFAECPEAESWIGRNIDGSPKVWGGAYYRWIACENHPDFRAYLQKVCRHGIEEIGLDGLHFDNCYQQPCYCEHCLEAFRNYLKKSIPDPKQLGLTSFDHIRIPPLISSHDIRDPLSQKWIDWRVESHASGMRGLYEYIKKLNPEICVLGNPAFPRRPETQNRLSIHPRLFGEGLDLMFAENGNFPRCDRQTVISQIRAFKLAKAAGYGVVPTAWTRSQNGLEIPGNSAEIMLSLAEAAAFGGVVGTTWALRTTRGDGLVIDNRNFAETLRNYLEFLDRNRELFDKPESAAKIALLYDYNSFAYTDPKATRHFEQIEEVLLRHRLQYDVLFSEDLTEKLKDYRLLILAGQSCISDSIAKNITGFVEQGGALLLTGDSGKYDGHLLEREENVFAGLFSAANFADCRRFEPISNGDNSDKWIDVSPVALPDYHDELAAKILRLLGEPAPPFEIIGNDKVLANHTILSDRREILHLLNYDTTNPADIEIHFTDKTSGNRKIRIIRPDSSGNDTDAAIPEDGNIKIKSITCCAIIVLE